MPEVVENRVVEMEFDNKQFEQGVSTSLSTLDKLKEALTFKNASSGFKEIQNGIRSIDFSPIHNSLNTVEDAFMTLAGSLKRNFFDEISNSIIGMGKQLYNNTLGQIKSGGQRRAMNIEQAKFKIKGLGVDWKSVSDDMDYAVSGTAYGIDQAANATAQFLASGVQAGDDMKAALRGISGIAAMTSADYDEIANIFTAAAGMGKVQAMELNRISQRGVNAAAAIAKQLGTTEEAVRDMASEGKLDFNTFATAMDNAFGEHAKKANETFTGSMSNMKAALSRIGEIFYAPYIENMIPVFNRLRETIDKFKNAMKEPLNEDKESVATKIADLYRKMSELFLAWSDTWEPALDALPDKMQMWFIALDRIGQAVDTFKDILVDVGEGVKELTKDASSDLSKLTEQEEQAARDIWIWGNWGNGEERKKNLEAAGMSYERVQAVVEKIVAGTYKWDKWLFKAAGISEDSAEAYEIHSWAVKKIIELYDIFHRVVDTTEAAMQKVWKVLRAIWQAYTTTWSKLTNLEKIHSPWRELVQTIRVAIKNFVIAGKRGENIKKTFQGFFAVIKLGAHIVASFIRYLRPIIRLIMTGEPAISKLTGEMGELTYSTVKAIIASGKIPATFKKISEAIQKVIIKIQEFAGGDDFSISGIFKKIVEKVKGFIENIKAVLKGEKSLNEEGGFLDTLKEKITTVFASVVAMAEEIGIPLGDIWEKVSGFVTKILDFIGTKLFGADFSFSDWFANLFNKEAVDETAGEDKGIIAIISEKIAAITKDFDGLWVNVKKFVKSIADGISAVWTMIVNTVKNLDKMLTSIFTFITKLFDVGTQNADTMQKIFQGFGELLGTGFLVARDILWSIREPLKEIITAVAEAIAGIAKMFSGITDWVANDPEHAYGAAAFFALIKVIEKIIDYKREMKVKDSVLYQIATFFDDMKTTMKEWQKEKLWRVFEIIGNTMIKIAVAMAILIVAMTGVIGGVGETAAQEAALQGFIYMFAFLASIFSIMALAQNIFKNAIDMTFLSIVFKDLSTTLLVISIGMAMIMANAKGLSGGAVAGVMGGMILIIAAIFAAVAGLTYLVSSWNIDEKKMAAVTTFVTAFGIAIKKIMWSVAKLLAIVTVAAEAGGGDDDAWDRAIASMYHATAAISIIMLALGGALAILFTTGKNIPDAKQLVALGAIMVIFTLCVKSLVDSLALIVAAIQLVDATDVWVALGMITAIMLVLMAVIAVMVSTLGQVPNPDQMLKGMLGIAAVLLVLGNAVISIASAAAILAMANVNNDQLVAIVAIVGIISLLMIALAAIGSKLGGGGGGLISFAVGLLMIATSIYLINAAIYTIIKAIVLLISTFVMLAAVWPSIKDTVPGMLRDLEQVLPRFIQLVGKCIVKLCEVILEAAPLIGECIAVIIATSIEVGWGYIPKVVDSFLKAMDKVLDMLLDGAETILPKLLLLLLAFIAFVDANALLLGYLLGDVLCKIVWGALEALMDFLVDTVLPTLMEGIVDLFKGTGGKLANRITDAMMSDEEVVESNQEIALVQTTEYNAVRKNHWKYYNPKTGGYYDTIEEAKEAELDAEMDKLHEKQGRTETIKAANLDVEIDQDITAKRKGIAKYEDLSGYEYQSPDATGLKEAAGGAWDSVKDAVGGGEALGGIFKKNGKSDAESYTEGYSEGLTSSVSQDAYIAGMQRQNEMAKQQAKANGKELGQEQAKWQMIGADEIISGASDSMSIAPTVDMSAYKDQLNLSGLDDMADANLEGLTQPVEYVAEDGTLTDDISSGKATISTDTSSMETVMQANTDTNKEQISMLDKVKNTLDELKQNLKDVIIMPKDTKINITNQLDKQVLGKSLTPVVTTEQQRRATVNARMNR